MIRAGHCLCGAVKVTADTGSEIQICHCLQCQRWSGGGPLHVIKAADVQIEGKASIDSYRASHWGERSFCGTCGTTLFWRMQGQPVRSLAVGLFDDQSDMAVTEEIFVDYRPAWLKPYPGASQSTEAEELTKLDAFLAEQNR